MDIIKVIQFNVLAPNWIKSSLYPSQCIEKYFNPSRLEHKVDYIKQHLHDADFYALQETQEDENQYLARMLKGYTYYAVYHSSDYWREWRSDVFPQKRSGVAIAVNNSKFDQCQFRCVKLSHYGNSAAIVKCRHISTGRYFQFCSIHLDTTPRRIKEFQSLLEYLDDIDTIVCGDFNSNIRAMLLPTDLRDALYELGIDQSTIPKVDIPAFTNIDHIVIRGDIVPVSGKVHDMGVWKLNSNRYCETVARNGSDHFSTECELEII